MRHSQCVVKMGEVEGIILRRREEMWPGEGNGNGVEGIETSNESMLPADSLAARYGLFCLAECITLSLTLYIIFSYRGVNFSILPFNQIHIVELMHESYFQTSTWFMGLSAVIMMIESVNSELTNARLACTGILLSNARNCMQELGAWYRSEVIVLSGGNKGVQLQISCSKPSIMLLEPENK